MRTTNNLGLKKPEGTDIVDIADLNGNMDTLDSAVKSLQDHAADTHLHITDAERTQWNAKETTAGAQAKANAAAAASVPLTQKGAANGVAPLDVYGKVPLANLPTGAGNGIDADKLDGHHYTDFLLADGTNSTFLELGANRGSAGPAYIDFHTSGTVADWNARIIAEATGRLGLSAADNIYLDASTTYARDKLWVRPDLGLGSLSDLHIAIGDSDTGFKWNNDGNFDIWSNGVRVANVSDGWLRLRGEDNNYYHTGSLWHENTQSYRALGELYRGSSSAQTINGNTTTKVLFTTLNKTQQGMADAANGRFIIPHQGMYLVDARIGINPTGSGLNHERMDLYINGGFNCTLSDQWNPPISGVTLTGNKLLWLNPGDYVEIYAACDNQFTVSQNAQYSFFTISRVA